MEDGPAKRTRSSAQSVRNEVSPFWEANYPANLGSNSEVFKTPTTTPSRRKKNKAKSRNISNSPVEDIRDFFSYLNKDSEKSMETQSTVKLCLLTRDNISESSQGATTTGSVQPSGTDTELIEVSQDHSDRLRECEISSQLTRLRDATNHNINMPTISLSVIDKMRKDQEEMSRLKYHDQEYKNRREQRKIALLQQAEKEKQMEKSMCSESTAAQATGQDETEGGTMDVKLVMKMFSELKKEINKNSVPELSE